MSFDVFDKMIASDRTVGTIVLQTQGDVAYHSNPSWCCKARAAQDRHESALVINILDAPPSGTTQKSMFTLIYTLLDY